MFWLKVVLNSAFLLLQTMARSLLKGLRSFQKMQHLTSPLTFQVLHCDNSCVKNVVLHW